MTNTGGALVEEREKEDARECKVNGKRRQGGKRDKAKRHKEETRGGRDAGGLPSQVGGSWKILSEISTCSQRKSCE